MDDQTLMLRVAANDGEAVKALATRLRPIVTNEAQLHGWRGDDIEDVVQEVLIRLWRSARTYSPRKSKLVTWMGVVTRHYLWDQLRRSGKWGRGRVSAKAFRPQMLQLTGDVAWRPRERPEGLGTILARSRFPGMLTDLYARGMTLKQYAEANGQYLGSVKSRLSRALLEMRRDLPS